jgi:hypothetical protein
VLVLGRAQPLAAGRHEIDGEEVVDREAVLAHQPADATAEREPGDSGVAHDSTSRGQTVRLRLAVEVAPERSTLAEAFVKWHAGQLTWAQATRDGRIQVDGVPSLARAFPTWNARSMFAHIRAVSRTTSSAAG